MNNSHGQPGPFAPPPLQGFHHYYEPVRRRARATVLWRPAGHSRTGLSLSPPLQRQYRGTPSHVPHESRRPGSRHLCAGHRLAS